MIFFRRADEPRIGSGTYWHVEFYQEEGSVFPVGTAYVECPLDAPPRMNFVVVADQWRSRGIASRLMAGCVEKWPNLEFSEPISRFAEKAIKRAVTDQNGFTPRF